MFNEMRNDGGFEGNAQTLRQLACLEKYTSAGHGMNPTRRFVLSVLKYPVVYSAFDVSGVAKPPKCFYGDEQPIVSWALDLFTPQDRELLQSLDAKGKAAHRVFDCSLMELADDIAFGVHDLEDIVARRFATKEQWKVALDKAFDPIGGSLHTDDGVLSSEIIARELFADSWQRKRLIGRLVNLFMAAARVIEKDEFTHPLLKFRVGLVGEHEALLTALKRMAFHLAIDKAAVQQLERRGRRVVQDVFRALSEDPEHLVPNWHDTPSDWPQPRRICDYVGGMTDAYAEKVYSRLFVPGSGSSLDEL